MIPILLSFNLVVRPLPRTDRSFSVTVSYYKLKQVFVLTGAAALHVISWLEQINMDSSTWYVVIGSIHELFSILMSQED